MIRRKSKEIRVGNVFIGSDYPVRIQSMTNTDPQNTEDTVAQIIRLFEAGSEMVRLAVPRVRDVEVVEKIKEELDKRGYSIPLIADVHFNPAVSEMAAGVFEKVRINPGNYAEESMLSSKKYNDHDYELSLGRLRANLRSLIDICNAKGTALRIGVNHGSLSSRILYKYGNTIAGMVASSMEYLRICREFDFNNLIVSLKASNPKVMLEANRFLVEQMSGENMPYPVHLGVTEAGSGEDGRIKSAIGIGSLLVDGIGDTIRVSLTENPVLEVPFAQKLCSYIDDIKKEYVQPGKFEKASESKRIGRIGGGQMPVVVSEKMFISGRTDFHPDFIIDESGLMKPFKGGKDAYRPMALDLAVFQNGQDISLYDNTVILLQAKHVYEFRACFSLLKQYHIKNPVVLVYEPVSTDQEIIAIEASVNLGTLLIDGFADGIWIKGQSTMLAFNILQAAKRRISQTEFIMCPSCGRTKFNLESVANEVKKETCHLKGVSIAVMGCIVNGPGEMGEADYGYIGAGNRKVNLYRKQKLLKKNIDESNAVKELIDIIKKDGKWTEAGK